MMIQPRFGVGWAAFRASGVAAFSTTLAIIAGLMPKDKGPFAGDQDRRRFHL
jgi:hypothetical protein